jgi:hypothetical protein
LSRTIAAAAALIVIAIVIHYSALSGWWLYDDPQLLIEAIRQPAGDILFNPAEYTHLAAHTFTPLLLLSFKLDLAMQDLRPTWFYAHQVVALTIAAVLFFFLLRRYVADLYAFAGAALFLTSWTAVYAARTLMIDTTGRGWSSRSPRSCSGLMRSDGSAWRSVGLPPPRT